MSPFEHFGLLLVLNMGLTISWDIRVNRIGWLRFLLGVFAIAAIRVAP